MLFGRVFNQYSENNCQAPVFLGKDMGHISSTEDWLNESNYTLTENTP